MMPTSPIEPFDAPIADDPVGDDPVADYRQEARDFLAKSRHYLAEGDLHQASEKGWAAAAWMAKAVAEAQGWDYTRHAQFSVVLNHARQVTGDARLPGMRGIANELHGNFYTRRRFLNSAAIAEDLNQIALMLTILEPLTQSPTSAAVH